MNKEPQYILDAIERANKMSLDELIDAVEHMAQGDCWEGSFSTRGYNEYIATKDVLKGRVAGLIEQLDMLIEVLADRDCDGVVHQCALLEKRVNALQTAISPLSELYKDYRGDENVIYSFVSDDGKTSQLTFGDVRRAYEVLNEA